MPSDVSSGLSIGTAPSRLELSQAGKSASTEKEKCHYDEGSTGLGCTHCHNFNHKVSECMVVVQDKAYRLSKSDYSLPCSQCITDLGPLCRLTSTTTRISDVGHFLNEWKIDPRGIFGFNFVHPKPLIYVQLNAGPNVLRRHHGEITNTREPDISTQTWTRPSGIAQPLTTRISIKNDKPFPSSAFVLYSAAMPRSQKLSWTNTTGRCRL